MTALSKWQSKLILLFKSERTFNAQAIVSEFTKKNDCRDERNYYYRSRM